MVFVNGMLLVLIEAKSATTDQIDYENAIDQIHRYERGAPRLFVPHAFSIATDFHHTVYGATGALKQYYLEWNDEKILEKFDGDTFYACLYAVLDKKRLIDLVHNFILFEKNKKGIVKMICRYPQYNANE